MARRLSRYAPYIEVGLFFAFLLIYIWVIMPLGKKALNHLSIIFLFLFTFVSHHRHRTGWKELGLRFDNFAGAMKMLIPVTVVVVLLFLTAGWFLNSLRLGKGFMISVLAYPLWGMVQQYALQSFVNIRLRAVLENEHLVALAGTSLFAAAHWPNGWLMAFTFVAGYYLSLTFCRRPNLPAVAIIHGILGTMLSHTLPVNLLHRMIIGPRYYQ